MFASGRLASRVGALNLGAGARLSCRAVVPKQWQSTAAAKENFFAKQARLNRPMSPHLSIYAPQISSLLSICHRISGVGFGLLISGVTIGVVATGTKWEDVCASIQETNLSPEITTAGKFFFALPFTYHTANGIRHLFQDRVIFMTLPGLYKTGYVMMGVSVVSALALTQL